MMCPLCGRELDVYSTHTEVRNGEGADACAKLFCVKELSCYNSRCANYHKLLGTSKESIYPVLSGKTNQMVLKSLFDIHTSESFCPRFFGANISNYSCNRSSCDECKNAWLNEKYKGGEENEN